MGQTVRQAPSSVNLDEVQGVTTSAGNIMPANTNRTSATLQNVGTNKVYIRFGSAPVIGGTQYFSAILSAASTTDDGDGGSMTIDHFKGDIYAITASGDSTLIATEFIK
jgi:hypothetical protein